MGRVGNTVRSTFFGDGYFYYFPDSHFTLTGCV
jgi:hypothetical protein